MAFKPIIGMVTQPLRVSVCGWGDTYLKRRPGEFVSRPSWRIYRYPDSGGGIEWHGNVYTPKPDEFLIVPPHTEVRHVLHKPCWHQWFHVGFGQPYDAVSGRIFILQSTTTPEALFDAILNPPEAPAPEVLRIIAFATYLLTELPPDIWPAGVTDPRIQRVLSMVHEQVGTTFDNTTLAQAAGMSRNAFIRLFSKEVGQSPRVYSLERRLDEACRLLAYGSRTIDDIAEACGFGDRGYMSRVFTKKLGYPPGRYRRERRMS